MEEGKYYRPKINEFRVGFAYQKMSRIDKKVWKDKIVTGNDNLSHLEKCVSKRTIRVKHLDAVDIVDTLGFRESKTTNVFGKICTTHRRGSELITIMLGDDSNKVIILDETYTHIFSGILLNLSELITQLKRCQVEINE